MTAEPENVVSFPERPQRSWRILEAQLCPMLYHAGADANQVAHLCRALQPIWENQRGLTVPAGTDREDRVQQVNRWFAGVALGLLLEIGTRELKLFNAGIE